MVKNRTLYFFFSCLSLLMLVIAFYFLYIQAPLYAWIATIGAVCSTKGRIAVGGRVKRTVVVFAHLAFSISGFLCLTYLAFGTFETTPVRLLAFTTMLYALAFCTGLPAWFEGVIGMYSRSAKQ